MIELTVVPQTSGAAFKESSEYNISVNGQSCSAYACRVSRIPFNRIWPGHQRASEQSEDSAFLHIITDETVTVSVTPQTAFNACTLRPINTGSLDIMNASVSVTLTAPAQFVLEFDDEHRAIHIFVDVPDLEQEKGECATYYFGPGLHFPGLITLNSNESVYIHQNAVVYGSIIGRKVQNVRVYGHGVLDGSYEKRVYENCYEDFTKGCMRFYDSRKVYIEGIIFKDSAIWVLSIFGCEKITIDNIKMVGHWRYNTDGIDIVNSSYVTVKNSFIRVFDDGIVLKGIDAYCGLDVKHISVSHCIFWCGWGRTLEVGLETACREMKHINFSDCDLIHNSGVCMDVQNGDYAQISDMKFDNIRIEIQKNTYAETIQISEDQEFIPVIETPTLIGISDPRYRQGTFYAHLFQESRNSNGSVSPLPPGIIRVSFRHIEVITDDEKICPQIVVEKCMEESCFTGITIEDIRLNGVLQNSLKAFNKSADKQTEQYVKLIKRRK